MSESFAATNKWFAFFSSRLSGKSSRTSPNTWKPNYIRLCSICGLPDFRLFGVMCSSTGSHCACSQAIRLSQKERWRASREVHCCFSDDSLQSRPLYLPFFAYYTISSVILLSYTLYQHEPTSNAIILFDSSYRFATDSVCMMRFLFRTAFVCGTAIGFVFYESRKHSDHRYV